MTKRLFLIVVTAVLALTAACGSTTGSGDGGRGGDGELVLGLSFGASTLDPDLMPIRLQWTYLDPVYDSLTRKAGDGSIEPSLATKWDGGSDDAGPYMDFTLRDGLTFPDGAPFSADTVIANVERSSTLEGSTNSPVFEGIDVEKIDETHVRFRSDDGVGAVPTLLSGPGGMMISQKAIADGTDLATTVEGIGPYRIGSMQPGRVVYEANEGYWDPEAIGTPTIVIEQMSDDARLNAVLSGDMDITNLPQRMMDTVENSGYTEDSTTGTQNFLFAVNPLIKPFDDPRVREALSLALNREEFCKNVWEGKCDAVGQFFAPGTQMFNEDVGMTMAPYDLDEAKKLIEEAGAAGTGFDLVINSGFDQMQDLAAYAQEQWAQIGIDANVTALAPTQAVSRFTVAKDAAVMLTASGLAFDPSTEVARTILPEGLYNVGQVGDAEVQGLAAQGVMETDFDRRMATYQKISADSMGNHLVIPLVSQYNTFAVSPEVGDWHQPWGLNFVSLRGVKG